MHGGGKRLEKTQSNQLGNYIMLKMDAQRVESEDHIRLPTSQGYFWRRL